MGNQVSRENPSMSSDHMLVYNKILQIKSPQTRVDMLKTILSGPEFVNAAKHAGIYMGILQYMRAITYNEPGLHLLPGEKAPVGTAVASVPRLKNAVEAGAGANAGQGTLTIMHNGKAQKAKDYFNWSLEVLGLSDTDGLTLEGIKQAYKKAAARAHPDKQGGSEKAFKDVTKASTYLIDIVSKITGRRPTDKSVEHEIKAEQHQRKEESDKWANFKPAKLDPKNLNMKAFNDIFEQTHMKDEDEDGYENWLKGEGEADIPKPKGEYNREAFMRNFEDNIRKTAAPSSQQLVLNPNAMALVAPVGTELGRDRPAEYTAPFMADANYTDLRAAYTQHNTIMNHVANVRYEERSYDKYKSSYEAGPGALSAQEQEMLRRSEEELQERERLRQLRHAQQQYKQLENAERLRTMLISNGSILPSKK
jgi:curved DNA-binding protein CbpA